MLWCVLMGTGGGKENHLKEQTWQGVWQCADCISEEGNFILFLQGCVCVCDLLFLYLYNSSHVKCTNTLSDIKTYPVKQAQSYICTIFHYIYNIFYLIYLSIYILFIPVFLVICCVQIK